MVMGSNFLTTENYSLYNLIKKIQYFKNGKEVLKFFEKGELKLHSFIWIKIKKISIKKIRSFINIRLKNF
jgi:hypothetical protein